MDKLPEGVKQGQMLQAKTEQGEMNVVVTEIKETTATVDANHPLAGKKLIFDLEVVEVM
jgi:FKBP-type peptidyl-prolyl cis-trans isomerase 2